MKVVIRTDSSSTIGSGHLMRCLTLASGLRRLGATIAFVCRNLPGNFCRKLEEGNFSIHRIGDDEAAIIRDTDVAVGEMKEILRGEGRVDWLIVDHYALDKRWERSLRKKNLHIMVIDDRANRSHDCDLLLDQNFFPDAETRYDDLVPAHCQKLFGPRYALLRPEFAEARGQLRQRDGSIKRILITMGGADPNNVTPRVLEAVKLLDRSDITIDVIVGTANEHGDEIESVSSELPVCNIHYEAKNMASLMAEADLCIGAGGSTTWERCCLGLPALFIAASDNDIEIARSAGEAGIGKYLGTFEEISPQKIVDELQILIEQPDLLRKWGTKAASLVDGLGLERVCQAMMENPQGKTGV